MELNQLLDVVLNIQDIVVSRDEDEIYLIDEIECEQIATIRRDEINNGWEISDDRDGSIMLIDEDDAEDSICEFLGM